MNEDSKYMATWIWLPEGSILCLRLGQSLLPVVPVYIRHLVFVDFEILSNQPQSILRQGVLSPHLTDLQFVELETGTIDSRGWPEPDEAHQTNPTRLPRFRT
jgi:hypothetical protein